MRTALIQIEGSRIEVNAWPVIVARLDLAPSRLTAPPSRPAQAPEVKTPGLLDRVVAGVSEWGWRHLDISVQPHRHPAR